MDELTFQKIINGKDIWLSCLPMITIILVQSILYFKNAVQEARRLDITPDKFALPCGQPALQP